MLSPISTSSPSIIPPWSRALFQLKPQSLRLIVVLATKPAWVPRVWPPMPTGPIPRNSTSRVTGLLTPRIVRSPRIWNFFGSFPITLVLLKVSVGYFSTQKKSWVRRWLSRRSTPVNTLLSRTVTSTEEAARFWGS